MVHSKIFRYNPPKYDKNGGFVKASDTICFDMPNLDLLSGCHRRRSPLFLKNSFGKKKILIFARLIENIKFVDVADIYF